MSLANSQSHPLPHNLNPPQLMAADLYSQSPALATAQNTQPPPTDNNLGPNSGPKRHRRPSVRLGEIGDQPATLRTSKPWRLNPHPNPSPTKSFKTRPITNLVTPTNGNFAYSSAETTTNNGSKFLKSNIVNKRARTNFMIDQPQEEQQQSLADVDDDEERENGLINHGFNDDDDGEEGFRDFDPDVDGSDPDESPFHSGEQDDDGVHLDMWHAHSRRSGRATRVSNSNHDDLGFESNSRNQGMGLDDGVRKWLLELGLARYAPVFEIHEVDDEVLPYLTLDDLKDMGITAVGTRRKLYSDILKLRKGLS